MIPGFNSVTEDYRRTEESWWLALDNTARYSGDHEALQGHIVKAEWRMVERLVAVALCENLLCLETVENADSVILTPRTSSPDAGTLKAENFKPALTVLEARFSSLCWRSGAALGEWEAIRTPVVLLAWLVTLNGQVSEAWQRLAREVAESVLNDALSRDYRHRRHQRIVSDCRQENIGTLWAWVQSRSTRYEIPLWLEQWSAVGHPLHLAPKNRSGLDPSDLLECFPEFNPQVPVRLAAVVKSFIDCELHAGLLGYEAFIAEEFPLWSKRWAAWLMAQGRDPVDFFLLPLHPIQVSKYLPALQGSVFSEKEVLLDGPRAPCHPTLSVRTVVPCIPDSAPHIKLALGVRLTSMRRNLSQRSCVMGPRISALLEAVIGQDPHLARSLSIAPELVGVFVKGVNPLDGELQRDLSAIFRRNPTRCINSEETLIPASALPLISPVSGKPFFLELLDVDLKVKSEQVLHEFRTYARILLRPVLRLFFRYGILMEAHPQNTFLVVDGAYRPRRILLRDLGGIRIHEPTLRGRGFRLDIHHDRLTVCNSWTTARRRLMHAVFQWHLGHLAWSVSRATGLKEEVLWRQTREVTSAILDQHQADMPEQRWCEETAFLMESDWLAKSSLQMRLNDTSDELYVSVSNPMAGSSGKPSSMHCTRVFKGSS